MSSLPVLFVHGGPGINSVADEAVIGPYLQREGRRLVFWNEPSRQRPNGEPFLAHRAYQGLVESVVLALRQLSESASAKVTLVAHSFAANAVYQVALLYPEWIDRIILLSPAFHQRKALMNLVGLAEKDLEHDQRGLAIELRALADRSVGVFDDSMLRACRIAMGDPLLFTHYWCSQKAMEIYFGAWAKVGQAFDMESFEAVMTDFHSNSPRLAAQVLVPTVAVFGKYDRVIDRPAEELTCRALFPSLQVVSLVRSGHFPQIEEPREVAALIDSLTPL
jgi:pimeloyl-ACP methyl ester carboxylesterase